MLISFGCLKDTSTLPDGLVYYEIQSEGFQLLESYYEEPNIDYTKVENSNCLEADSCFYTTKLFNRRTNELLQFNYIEDGVFQKWDYNILSEGEQTFGNRTGIQVLLKKNEEVLFDSFESTGFLRITRLTPLREDGAFSGPFSFIKFEFDLTKQEKQLIGEANFIHVFD